MKIRFALLTGLALGTVLAPMTLSAQAVDKAAAKTADAAGTAAKKTKDVATGAAKTTEATAKKAAHKGGPTQNASATEIADAKAKGMVWVNTGTGVYHNDGEYFGATKEGKFMTVADADKAGFHAAGKGKKKMAKMAKAKVPAQK